MTHCVWNTDAPETGIYVCQNCSQRSVKIPPSQRMSYPKRICKEPRGPCAHLGDSTRQQECDSCAGKTRIKVFACQIFGECTLAKPLPSLACCAGCGDYCATCPPGVQ